MCESPSPCPGDSPSPRGSPRAGRGPGAAALDNMKLLAAESRIFKVPADPREKTRRIKKTKVLDEEEYVEGIAKIIQRDFFPDLDKLNAQNEYLEASENNDYVRLQEITRKYSGSRPMTDPYCTPATFDTPGADRPYTPVAPTVREDGNSGADTVRGNPAIKQDSAVRDITSKHTLDSFLSLHTSEDNSSYDRVISLENKKRAAKVAAQYEAEATSAELVERALALPSIERQADQMERPDELDTWKYTAKNYIMYVPDGSGQPPPIKPELQHHNTRLCADPFDLRKSKQQVREIAKSQGANLTGKIGVDGTCLGPDKPVHGFVATPSPRPGLDGDESPLMTWGEIEGTPFRLDGGDTPLPAVGAGAAYRMLEWGARERIGLKLAEQAAKKRRPTTPRVHATTPRTTTGRLATMSPAARKLAAKHLTSPRLKLTPATFGISHSAVTPKLPNTPGRRRPLVATPSRSKKAATPKTQHGNTGDSDRSNLTDNLLQINVERRRLKACDFF